MRNNKGQYVKGFSGNRNGRPQMSMELRTAYETSKLKPEVFVELISKFLFMSMSELELLKDDKSLPVIDHALISVLLEVSDKGDIARLDCLLNRIVGKPLNQIEIQAVSSNSDRWEMLPQSERVALREELSRDVRVAVLNARKEKFGEEV